MNNPTVLRLQRAPEFDITRAGARPHTLASFPLTKSGGKDARVVWVVEYMYICDLGHSVPDAVSAPVAGPDQPPRSASLHFGGWSLNPGSNQGRRKRRGAFAPAVSA
nr:MAG TPA: hypothetical protein [Caudoviricetes sp.]